MEKKGTRTAYLIAWIVIIVLLIILKVTVGGNLNPILVVDGELVETTTSFAGMFWSLLAPIVVIALALISKEVYSSLFFGCMVGALLVANYNPWETVVAFMTGNNGLVNSISGNVAILIFLVILGIMVDLKIGRAHV